MCRPARRNIARSRAGAASADRALLWCEETAARTNAPLLGSDASTDRNAESEEHDDGEHEPYEEDE